MILACTVFWVAVLLMAHSYVLFPSLLNLLAYNQKNNTNCYEVGSTALPEVSIIIAAHNEEAVIEEKIRSLLDTSYPFEKLEILIGSDKSTDRTNELIRKYAQVQLIDFQERTGKAGIVNVLSQRAQGSIFILTDANVLFERDTIYQLVKHFKNEQIVQVGANILNPSHKKDGISFQEKSYLHRENVIKYKEGVLWGAMMGAFGGCYAIRKDSFVQIPANYLMEDFYISMHALQLGGKAINELEALCYEDVSNQIKEEFRRKVRISAGNFQNLATFWPLLFRFNGVSFSFLSHKVIRWVGPFLLMAALISSAFVAFGEGSAFFQLMFFAQLIGMILPLLDELLKSLNIHLKLLRFISHFYFMNLALFFGLIRYINGVKTSMWTPTIRNQ